MTAHGYFGVDLGVVSGTVRTSLPALKAQFLQATAAARGE
jgi:uncharacterized protein with HEPN domain